jgi:hypothetical protein
VLRAGEIVSKEYDGIVNDLVQERSTPPGQSDEQKADIRMRVGAKRDFVHRDLGSQIDTRRNEVDPRRSPARQMEGALTI